MRGRRYLPILAALIFLVSLAAVNVPVPVISPAPVTFYVDMPPEGYIPGKSPGTYFSVDVYVNASGIIPNSTEGIVGWAFDVQVDPTVLEIYSAVGGDKGSWEGWFLWEFLVDYGYVTTMPPSWPYEPKFLVGEVNATTGYMDEVVEQITPTTPAGAGGTGKLVTLWFKSLNETAYSPIKISLWQEGKFQAEYRDATGTWYAVTAIDGHYNEPPPHDVAVTAITAPAEATQGDNITINVDVTNLGGYDETFNVTIRYDSVIDTKPVTLVLGGSTTIPFSWNTAGVEPDTYTITAEAILAGDADLTNNEDTTTIMIKPPPTGTLSVDTTPVKGEVFVNDISWGLAPQSRVVQVGTYNVSFGPVAGYITPSWQLATVSEDLTTTVEGVYEPINGTLTVTTTPVSGEVFVNGTSWGIAPQSRVVQIGTYNVSFGPVAGYIAPSWQLVTVYENLTTTVEGIYEPAGTLNVTTTPVSGEVFVNGTSWGLATQSRVVQIGTYNVSFGPVAGFYTPSWELATVYENVTTTVTGVYELIVHDVAVTDIRTTSYEVDINDPTQLTVTINVTVTNEGDLTETFDVIIRYDTTDIATKTVTNLPAGNSTIVNFDWDVTGLALGTYTIEAEAILADDADLTNNKKTSDWTIEIVPEFPTLTPLLLVLAILAVSAIVLKRKPLTKPSTSGSPTTQP